MTEENHLSISQTGVFNIPWYRNNPIFKHRLALTKGQMHNLQLTFHFSQAKG